MNDAGRSLASNTQSEPRTCIPRDRIASSTQTSSCPSFTELHATYSRRLYRTIFAITKSPEDTEDALQETFLRVYLHLNTFAGRSSIYTWLSQIAINSALMILRRRRARPEESFDEQLDNQAQSTNVEVRHSFLNPEEHLELSQLHAVFLRAIRRLDPNSQRMIQMQVMHGFSLKEISRTLDLSVTAVKARLHRARKRIYGLHLGKKCALATAGACVPPTHPPYLHKNQQSKKGERAYRTSESEQNTPETLSSSTTIPVPASASS